ncbi:dihydropyrimidinase [Enterovirga rhinocerotis]|uniref:Dihydropyrimidinase n=1 Tax=Enterovirga rhinocerotis TaxID=1339210 RepID=A0A4R7BUV4_9HYPH|nr:dihydropyrimidinase [Enterovirga rhinocerotis]TDR89580.1 dihydropyrimidinase [Enterovirga rhinocerotis]
MSEAPYDLVIRGGTVATASDVMEADVAIAGQEIAAIGRGLPKGAREIDAGGKLVLPGGIDPHCHIEQLSANGLLNADTWQSATTAAAFGGTTTVIAFAAQHRGMAMKQVVEDYQALAKAGAVVDYAYHLAIANPTEETLKGDVPDLVATGHSSLKVFMTYDRLKVDDEELLDVLWAARKSGALVCVHCENNGMISWMGKRLLEKGFTHPKYHAPSHPRAAEAEAIERLAWASQTLDQPVMVFHVSTAEGAEVVRRARGRGVKLFAETCTQYLFMTAADLDKPGLDGARWMCSPPIRTERDQEALWRALELGDLQIVSSDHAPYKLDETGKFSAGPSPSFKQIANGMPGVELRLPVMFDAMVSKGRLGLNKFVELTSTAPARIYNLPNKGSIAIGADADIAIWNPDREVTIGAETVHDASGYTPYDGRIVRGWPETVLGRGRILVEDGRLAAEPGSGRFLPRDGGEAARPAGRPSAEVALLLD